MTNFWSESTDQLLAALETTRDGLSHEEAARRLDRYGSNILPAHRRARMARLVAAQLLNPITVLLLIASALSIAVGERVDGSIIVGIVLISTTLGLWQEHRAGTTVAALLARVRTTVITIRDARETLVPIEDVVPGDIVKVVAGSCVPGDGRLLESTDLFVDQSALTGESFPADKNVGLVPPDAALGARTNTLYLGTHVTSGTGLAVVVHTGASSTFGAIAQRLALRPPATEFEHGVRRFGFLLLNVATLFVIAIFAINVALHRPVLDALLFTLALAVGLTPQLLPAILSVTLARGAGQMARHRVIVKRLASIEDLGGMEILCTDKTGTITQGIVAVHTAEDPAGAPSARVGLFAYLNAAHETGFPNPIDDALRATPVAGSGAYHKLDEIPYDFIRKRLSVVFADPTGRRLLVTKGALTSILDVCDAAEDGAGLTIAIAPAKAAAMARLEALSRQGYRCLGVGYREIAAHETVDRAAERGFTFVGLLSLADPIKSDAAHALGQLRGLGIRTIVVTGDNRFVAARVATDAGIESTRLVTGSELDQLSEAALVRLAPDVGVFAEVEPHQKERVIRALKKSGRAVGYLGDGINDAAALHAADVGISVDSAADVTKQAADIVLLDKDLGALARGVVEGRRAFANTLKYIFITTSATFGNMFSMAGASVIVPFLPLLPKQVLLINVLSDLPAMAIATDQLDPELVARPRRWNNREIGRFMLLFGLVSSVFDYLTFGVLLRLGVSQAEFRTGWFLESVLSELFILLVIRTRRPFFRSRVGPALLWISLAVGVATLLLPITPMAPPLGLSALPFRLLGVVGAIVAVYAVTADAIKRAFFRPAPT